MSVELFGSQTESQGRMPKRRGNWSHGGGKRFKRSRTGFKSKNQFINQLGGWSQRSTRRSRPVLREFNTRISTYPVGGGIGTRDELIMRMSSVPQAIRNAYQRIKIKKVEAFFTVRGTAADNNLDTIQFSVCKSNTDKTTINPLNVPGAQIKMMDVQGTGVQGSHSNISDCMRIARFYPTVRTVLDGENSGTGRGSNAIYVDTNQGTSIWNLFTWDIQGLETTVNVSWYLHVTILCDGQKSDLVSSVADSGEAPSDMIRIGSPVVPPPSPTN